MTTHANPVRDILRRFRHREDGAVAVEFVLIAPVLIGLYVGLFQISMLIMADRNVSHSASVMGDLATQVTTLDQAGVEDVLQAAVEVLDISNPAVWTNADVKMQLVSLKVDDSDNTVKAVGRATIGTGFDDPVAWTIDPRLLSTTSGAMIARVEYNFGLLSHGSDNAVNENNAFGGYVKLKEDFILKPRLSIDVPFTDADGNNGAEFTCSISGTGKVSC